MIFVRPSPARRVGTTSGSGKWAGIGPTVVPGSGTGPRVWRIPAPVTWGWTARTGVWTRATARKGSENKISYVSYTIIASFYKYIPRSRPGLPSWWGWHNLVIAAIFWTSALEYKIYFFNIESKTLQVSFILQFKADYELTYSSFVLRHFLHWLTALYWTQGTLWAPKLIENSFLSPPFLTSNARVKIVSLLNMRSIIKIKYKYNIIMTY